MRYDLNVSREHLRLVLQLLEMEQSNVRAELRRTENFLYRSDVSRRLEALRELTDHVRASAIEQGAEEVLAPETTPRGTAVPGVRAGWRGAGSTAAERFRSGPGST